MSWEVVKLSDIATSQYGFTASATENEIGPKYLRITDIVPNSINWKKVPFCAIDENKKKKYELSVGDIVVARTGPVGYAKLIRDQTDSVFASYLVRFKISDARAIPAYVGRLLESSIYKSYVDGIKGGVAQPNANAVILGSFKFKLPPVDYQEKVASILSAYDDLIENNYRRITLLERSAQLLYREWFVHLRFPGYETASFVDGLPKGWGRVSLSEIVSTQYGYTESASSDPVGPKFLRGTDINKHTYIDWSKVPYCKIDPLEHKKYALKQGDILVIRMADPGKAAFIETDIDAVFASYLVRMRLLPCHQNISNLYLFYCLIDTAYQNFISAASAGSTRKSAGAPLLTKFEILLPRNDIQSHFKEKIEPVRTMISKLLDENQKLTKARDLLLPRLMDGRIPVDV